MKTLLGMTLGALLLVPAAAFGAPPAPVQGPAQAPNKAVQAPTQAPVQAPGKATAMAPINSGYRTYSYQPGYRSYSYEPTAGMPVNYGVGNPYSPYRPRPAAGFNSAAFKATGQPYVP
jgi:hypothetical protein